MFDSTYTAGLQRLHNFAPKAGRDYAAKRNYDDTAHVSTLSPYIRHRIISEDDVLRTILTRHSPRAAEKFIQEVFWRTYWKGWLELRPGIWTDYTSDLSAAFNRIRSESGLRQNWEAACKGQTGIDCFDHWAQQLTETGYLHNHARMWFASIWIFTLRLPWTLGADFFLRQLIDGDAAANTLSWRWVGGLQTIGKTYLARPDNIAKYTDGRFTPKGLATQARPLDAKAHPAIGPFPVSDTIDPNLRTGLLITEDDLSPRWLLEQIKPVATAVLQTTAQRSPLMTSALANAFVDAALTDCMGRYDSKLGPVMKIGPDSLQNWMADNNIDQIVTSYMPIGPTADTLAGMPIRQIIRPYDSRAWPHATHGFFKFKDKIPKLLGEIRGLTAA